MYSSIKQTTPEQYDQLLKVWEASVRATHTFLSEDQIIIIKNQIISNQYFHHVKLFHIERQVADDDSNRTNNRIVGFIGINENKIEMLFIHPDEMGNSLGSKLLNYVVSNYNTNLVDVNEQNPNAIRFYTTKHRFYQIARSETDDAGNPFPIIHLKLDISL